MPRPAVFQAAINGDVQKLAELLQADPTALDARDEHGWSPLHWAAANGQLEIAEVLLKQGADPNARANGGETALHLADNPDLAALLLASGADREAEEAEDDNGLTALSWAVGEDNLELARLVAPANIRVTRAYRDS